MENEDKPLPKRQRRHSRREQQGRGYGWRYDSQHQGAIPHTQYLPQPPPSTSPPAQPAQHYKPVADMGTSLGYGQGMEYQYFDAPQPSQTMPRLGRVRPQQQRQAEPIPQDVSPVRVPTSRPLVLQGGRAERSLHLAADHTQAAAVPAQDTGMIQRVRIGKATLILTGSFIASRVLGLLRTSMFAFVFGTSTTSDAYLQAFLIPDLIFNIVAGGALSSAFIPVFTKYMVGEEDEDSAWHVASSALNLAIAIMMGLALLGILFARQLVPLYNPGQPAAQLDLITLLTRIMLLQAVILGGGVIIASVLNARQNFLLPAVGTVLYNVGLMAGLVPGMLFAFQNQRSGMVSVSVYAATWGVVLGALLQVAIQIPGLFKVGMRYRLSFDWRHAGVIQIGRQMIPRIINAAMLSMSIFVDRGLILVLGSWALSVHMVTNQKAVDGLITQYYQSLQLLLLPLGVFGMAVSTAAFPTLAEYVAKGRMDRVRSIILETLRSMIFLSIPSSIGLIVLGLPIIQVLLEHGAFTLRAAEATAVPLACFAIGLTGLTAIEILTRSFYALRDSITPVIVSVVQFILKIALSLLLVNFAVFGIQWGIGALALSTSLAGLFEAAALLWLLHQRIGGLQLRTLGLFTARILLASLIMSLALLATRLLLDMVVTTTNKPSLGTTGTIFALIKLLIEVFVGLFVYIRCARLLNIEELGPVKRVLDRLKLSWI